MFVTMNDEEKRFLKGAATAPDDEILGVGAERPTWQEC
jgi:hypothetical protein